MESKTQESRPSFRERRNSKVRQNFDHSDEMEITTQESRSPFGKRLKPQVQQYFDYLAEREKDIFGEYSRSDSFVVQYRKLKDGDEKFMLASLKIKRLN